MSRKNFQYWKPGTLMIGTMFAMLVLFAAGCSEQQSQGPQDTKITETAADPVAEAPTQPAAEMPEPVAEPVDTAAAAVDGVGEGVYQKACKACHDAGIANAPKLGDKDAWAARIAKGDDALFNSVKNGLNAMPPMGACMSCSDDDLRSAVAYLVSKGS